VRQSPKARFLAAAFVVLACAFAGSSVARPQQSQQPSQKPSSQSPQAAQASPQASPATPDKKPAAVPTGPQSTHFPILLLAEGSDQAWSLRIGLKGPERLDRNGYPPIPLEPADVVREGTTDSWTYHAKDSQTGAAVSVHILREPCSIPADEAKFAFTASVVHAQIGSAQGCARVATELFPKINNQPTDDDNDAKDKPAPPTVTKFKPPVAVAYITVAGRLAVRRGKVARVIPGKDNDQPCLSHDGKRLLYTTEAKGKETAEKSEANVEERTISIYDWTTGKSSELLRGAVQQASWSPDDSRITFRKFDGAKWQLWLMPADAPEKAALLYPNEVLGVEGWADAQTILADDLQNLYWIGDDGTAKQTLSSAELYGSEQFRLSSANTVRIHPLNPDLLLVSAELLPAAASAKIAANKEAVAQPGQVFFTYEIRSKRRVLLSPQNLSCSFAEWSRDGLQIFFTGHEAGGTAMTAYRMFWDGTSQIKIQDGSDLVIGE
jgi:hypothetical protein